MPPSPEGSTWSARATVELVLEAKKKSPKAWGALFKRCETDMANFCRHFMGPNDPLRRICETQDILHEAFVQAMEKIDCLENDAAFYAWIRTIIRRKISLKRRDDLRDRLGAEAMDRGALDTFEKDLATSDEAVRVLDAILELFPEHPEPMTVFSLLQLEKGSTPETLVDSLGMSRRTVYRRLEEGAKLLRKRLEG
ncbi:MAG: sigma-70 family RNA polymerase sigma factor [Planctomycetes bacterium]|nr:sigma-70 family RNA polymerase sigma factor [Planctomycetota bacterium]